VLSFSHCIPKRGALHRQAYAQSRAEGRARWAEVLTLRASNTPYTDQALDGLLPHADNRVNREQHRWIHPSSAVASDIRSWFETAGWTHPTDWPFVAHALVQLIESCLIEPEALDEHCARFAAKPESKGFHAGLVSPILAALEETGYAGEIAVEPFDYVPDGMGSAAYAIGYLNGLVQARRG
jgi:hypothetical protein